MMCPERCARSTGSEAITRAQREGTVTKHFAADELLALAKTWSFPRSYCAGPTTPSPAELRRRRRSVVEAVRVLVTPVSPAP